MRASGESDLCWKDKKSNFMRIKCVQIFNWELKCVICIWKQLPDYNKITILKYSSLLATFNPQNETIFSDESWKKNELT